MAGINAKLLGISSVSFFLVLSGGAFSTSNLLDLKGKTACVFGSSTAAGAGAADRDRAWTSRISAATGLAIVNMAHGGAVLVNDYEKIMIDTESEPCKGVDMWFFHYPSNDQRIGISNELFVKTNQKISEKCTSDNKVCWFVGIQPLGDKYPVSEKLSMMNDILKKIHAEQYVDVYSGLVNEHGYLDERFSSGDSIHLNNNGHKFVAHRVYEVLQIRFRY